MDLNMERSDDEEDTRLRRAMIRSQLEPLRTMLRKPINSGAILSLSLRYQCSDDLISTLIEAGCRDNGRRVYGRRRYSLLHFAVERRTTFITRMLLEYGADVFATNGIGYTPLHLAIVDNRLDQLLELLKWHDCPLDSVRNRNHETPLTVGLLNDSSDEILLALLNHGCDVDAQDTNGTTALHYCANRESTLIAQKIIENGASLNIKNYEGHTPLHLAVSKGHLDYVCMLLYYNASVNEEDERGVTTFQKSIYDDWHRANRPNAEAIALYLLEYVSDFEAKGKYGNTVLQAALEEDPRLLMHILERGGVNVNNTLVYCDKDVHILYMAWRNCKSYEVLKALWSRTNFEVFLETNVFNSLLYYSFLGVFCENCRLRNEQFIQYLYMMFDSPYIEKFISRPNKGDNEFIIEVIVSKCDLTLNMRLELIWLFLSYDVTIYFMDVCALYGKYGFDESVLLILMQASNIRASFYDQFLPHNTLVRRICFDNMTNDEYIKRKNENLTERDLYILDEEDEEVEKKHEIENHTNYCRFYTATFYNRRTTRMLKRHGHRWSPIGKIPSLLELSRDTVRRVIYKRWNTPGSFYVYQALSQLPVPPAIKDILYLKTPIYL